MNLLDSAVPITSPVEDPGPDLIEHILKRRGSLFIAGETNVGKSLLALEMAASLLSGQPLWGAIPVQPVKRALYVLAEHSSDTVLDLWRETGLVIPDGSAFLLVGPEKFKDHFVVARGELQHQTIDQIEQAAKEVDLLIFDPLAAFVRGTDVENDNALMRLAVDTLFTSAHRNGAASIIIGHKGKPSIGPDGKPIKKKRYAIRGASSIEDAQTSLFYMDYLGDEDDGLFHFIRAKYKGRPDPQHVNYVLMRNETTLTHTLLPGKRPHVEARRVRFTQKLAKYQAMYPQLNFTKAVEHLAYLEEVSTRTAFRWVKGEDEEPPSQT